MALRLDFLRCSQRPGTSESCRSVAAIIAGKMASTRRLKRYRTPAHGCEEVEGEDEADSIT